jgi:hypothetical protein
MSGHEQADAPVTPAQDTEISEAELAQQFVMWVETMLHDIESVPDESSNRHWCPEWWRHPEAVSRFSALYEAYQQAVGEQTMSAWWTQHWDTHARVLFSQHGPFKDCQRRHSFHERSDTYIPRLETVSPPEDWTP